MRPWKRRSKLIQVTNCKAKVFGRNPFDPYAHLFLDFDPLGNSWSFCYVAYFYISVEFTKGIESENKKLKHYNMHINFKKIEQMSLTFESKVDQLNFLTGYIEARKGLKETGSGPAYELGKSYGQYPPPQKKTEG
ncbi:hypothetical protein [Leptospira kirschneri]|uniref:hypothetical protein n=1 Tax=Leptospira kirschneri TaxID=29507 RepID=UPI0021C95DC0|nr:hypothetical protein [Leptospira kirschneri]UML79120.1 hypothetical protein FH602_12295 [Leptospira kirschneri]